MDNNILRVLIFETKRVPTCDVKLKMSTTILEINLNAF